MEEWVIAIGLLVAGAAAVARVAGWKAGEKALAASAKILDKVKAMVVKPSEDEEDVK